MKCLVHLFSDAQLNFEEWHHAKDYSCSVAEVAKLWQTKKLGFHVEILNQKSGFIKLRGIHWAVVLAFYH
ncbi:MAG: hypothetical protein H0U73_03320 [Tatlockia sp.]|nr:hypothetical protein [Tatlockia sp.]